MVGGALIELFFTFYSGLPTTVLRNRLSFGMTLHLPRKPAAAKAGKNPKNTAPGDVNESLPLASNPTTPPSVLETLARVEAPGVRWQVALNPNTPEPVLHKLWSRFHPLAALENPILAYHTLATGKSFHELLPISVKLALYDALRREGREAELEDHLPETDRCTWLSYHWGNREPLDIPKTILNSAERHLATDASIEVRKSMLQRLPASCMEIFAGDPEPDIRIALAKNLRADVREGGDSNRWSRVIDQLSADPEEGVRKIVAKCKDLTPEAHEKLAQDSSLEVRKCLAAKGDGKALREQGWRMLMGNGESMCLLIAMNRGCHESVRLDLTAHLNSEIRVKAWFHLNFETVRLTEKLQQRLEDLLCHSLHVDERVAVATNPTITPPVIQRLLGCEDPVTRALAANKRLSEDDRAVLLRHADEETAVNAMKTSESTALVDFGAKHPFAAVRAVVAGMVGSRAAELRPQLAADASLKVCEAVRACLMERLRSYDGRIMREAIAILSRSPHAKLRAKVVEDCRLPADELPRLCKDPSVLVRLAVLKYKTGRVEGHLGLLDHKRTSVRVSAAELVLRSWHRDVSSKLDEKVASDPSPKVRKVAASSSVTSLKVLEKLIRDKSPEVQLALVKRETPRTRNCLLKWLAHTGNHGKPDSLSALTTSLNPYRRAVAAGVYRAGKRRLRKLAADKCWYVRAITAKNGHDLEPNLLTKLMEDPHPIVREQAKKRMAKNWQQFPRLTNGGRP